MNNFAFNNGMCMQPLLVPPSAWVGHIPFAGWLVEELKPKLLVELGTHHGTSFLAFCQAVVENELTSVCYAVDTWQGDAHAGEYGEEVFAELDRYHAQNYSSFSSLLRMTFDDASKNFADGSIDLLHIDGLHTYESVKNDFETWLPKMSSRGVVLFHDTVERKEGFGVWRLWQELVEHYPAFEFHHSHGLGVLMVGNNVPDTIVALDRARNSPLECSVRLIFSRLADLIDHKEWLAHAEKRIASLDELARAAQILRSESESIAAVLKDDVLRLEKSAEEIMRQKELLISEMEHRRKCEEEVFIARSRQYEAQIQNLNAIYCKSAHELAIAGDERRMDAEKHARAMIEKDLALESLSERNAGLQSVNSALEKELADLRGDYEKLRLQCTVLQSERGDLYERYDRLRAAAMRRKWLLSQFFLRNNI